MAKMAKSAAALALEALDELLDTIGQIQSLHEHTIAESAPLPAAVKSRFDKLRNQYTAQSLKLSTLVKQVGATTPSDASASGSADSNTDNRQLITQKEAEVNALNQQLMLLHKKLQTIRLLVRQTSAAAVPH
eukprot:INCI19533.2.p1 GENE.INCI19533.2~~INCI19533.2.p1  ORF type:complete len:132 (-),score=24.27 INCI19533.2:145-540(-)